MTFKQAMVLAGLALAACATAPIERPPEQIAFFNHGYAVLDAETAEAISASALLRELMVFEQRTTEANDGNRWTARYLYGRETYFEFFGPGDLGPGMERPHGATGLAISPDHAGLLARVNERLSAAGVEVASMRRTRLLGGQQIDWFDTIAPNAVLDNTATMWVMEYLPSYFENPLSEKEPAESPEDVISRERYHPDTYRERLARDVSSIEIAAPAADIAEMRAVFVAGGFLMRDHGGGFEAHDADIRIVLTPAQGDGAGLRRLEFALNATASTAREERIGHSTLTVGPGRTAIWTFD